MKSFLKKTIVFALCVLLLGLSIECGLLFVSNEYTYKRKYVEEQGDRIKVLVLGHSHAGNGIIPEYMGDSVFNMAINGRNRYYDAVIARRYIPRLKNLSCVIWPLGYNFQYVSVLYPCTGRRKKNVEKVTVPAYQQCMYEKYMDISYERFVPYLHWSEILNSKMDYGSRAFKRSFEDQNQCTPSGYERRTLSERSLLWKTEKLPLEVDYDNPHLSLARREGLEQYMEIARTCREAGVRLVVVTFPCYRSYVEEITERGRKEMLHCVDSMRSVYPSMEYYDFMDDRRFVEDDFYNSSHLAEEGARKFSLILKETLFPK